MAADPRQGRILAMQALCQWEVQHDESRETLYDFLTSTAGEGGEIGYATRLVEAFWLHREDVDRRIGAAALRWELPRISPVERNAMRVAVTEWLIDEVPPRVALDEAIEIGREYGGADSPRFINGVLDKVLRDFPRAQSEPRP